jgi:hypothetical protein
MLERASPRQTQRVISRCLKTPVKVDWFVEKFMAAKSSSMIQDKFWANQILAPMSNEDRKTKKIL